MLSPWRLAMAVSVSLAAVVPMAASALAPMAGTDQPMAMTLRPGQTGSVDLQTNASTGYMWKVDAPPGIAVTLARTVPTRPGMVGAPSVATYHIVGRKRGTYRLVFRYMRPWEGKAVRTLIYRIRIA